MYNSFGVIQNNFQKTTDSEAQSSYFLTTETPLLISVSFYVLGKVSTAMTDRMYSSLHKNC